MNKKEKLMKVLVIFAIIAGIVSAGLFIGNQVFGITVHTSDSKTTVVDVTLLESRLQAVGKIETAEYTFSTAAESQKEYRQVLGVNIPFTSKQIKANYDGVVIAGFDLDRITVQNYKDSVLVTLPEPSITSTEFYNEDYTYESSNPLNMLDNEDYDALKTGVRLEMVSEAIDHGIYDEAKSKLEEYIQNFVKDAVGSDITVNFQYI